MQTPVLGMRLGGWSDGISQAPAAVCVSCEAGEMCGPSVHQGSVCVRAWLCMQGVVGGLRSLRPLLCAYRACELGGWRVETTRVTALSVGHTCVVSVPWTDEPMAPREAARESLSPGSLCSSRWPPFQRVQRSPRWPLWTVETQADSCSGFGKAGPPGGLTRWGQVIMQGVRAARLPLGVEGSNPRGREAVCCEASGVGVPPASRSGTG